MDSSQREVRVFISSTFRDLQPEREYLIKRVFPQLRRFARERELEFTEIDLRWGLTEDDATMGKVVRTCLEEIDRSSPFFLCILGDRYGWSPQYTDIQKDPTLLHDYPWLEEAVLEGASILELEASYALLRSAKTPGQFVYARVDESSLAQGPDGMKLDALKQQIAAAGHPINTFRTPEELGALVRRDLLGAIDLVWPEPETKQGHGNRQAIEHRMHEAFAAARRKAYIADAENISALNRHIEKAQPPLVVAAESGMGKSALLAYWAKYYKARHPDCLIVSHFVGLTGTGSSSKNVLRHLFAEIVEHLGDASQSGVTEDNLATELPGLLARTTGQIVIVIDALNQLDDGGENLDWLPNFLPENVHLILSTTPGPSLEALRARGSEILELKPLRVHEREALLIRYLGEYRKQLSVEQSRRIAKDEKTASPLFLRTLIEELRLSGDFENLEERISGYLSSTSLDELFEHVLERMESNYGDQAVREILTLIWASQNGLAEREVLDLSGLTRADFSAFLIAMDYQLVVRDGIITLFHDYLREAAQKRYLSSEEAKREVHTKLADYFMAERLTKRGAEELLWQLRELDDNTHLRQLLSEIEFILFYADEDRKWDYLRLWRELDEEGYAEALEGTAKEQSDAERTIAVGQLLYDAGKFFHAERVFRPVYDSLEQAGTDDATMASLLGKLGQTYQALSRLDDAEGYLRKQLELAEMSFGGESREVTDALDSMGSLLYKKCDYAQAAECLERAVRIERQNSQSFNRRLINLLTNLGAILYEQNRYAEAKDHLEDALIRMHQANQDQSADAFSLLNNLAAIYLKTSEPDRASDYFHRALLLSRRVYGPHHVETIRATMNVGMCEVERKNFDSAQVMYEDALKLARTYLPNEDLTLSTILGNLGHLHLSTGEMERAELELIEALNIRKDKLSHDTMRVMIIEGHLAYLYKHRGEWERASEIYARILPRRIELLGEDNPAVQDTANQYKYVLEKIREESAPEGA